MTALVVEAERRGELPPTRISPAQPELRRQQPSLAEVGAAFDLYGLSRSITFCFCSQDVMFPDTHTEEHSGDCHPRMDWSVSDDDDDDDEDDWFYSGDVGPGESLSRMPEWRARVSRAVFRLLIVGAALAGAYQEPLFRAREHPDPDIRALVQRVTLVVPGDEDSITLTQKELDFLLQFPICDLDATLEAQDAIFGPLADWLLESIMSDEAARQAMAERFEERRGRAEYCIEEGGPGHGCPLDVLADGRGTHSDAHLVVWELMQLLWLALRFRPSSHDSIFQGDTACPPSSCGADAGGGRWGPVETESAVAVLFGVFRAEEAVLKPIYGDLGLRSSKFERNRFYMKSYPAVPNTTEREHGDGKLPSRASSVTAAFEHLFTASGRPNHFTHYASPVPPLELKFFEYFLQRHLNSCFISWLFGQDDGMSIREFEAAAAIFAHDDDGVRHPVTSHLADAGFVDGSEIVWEAPPVPFERFYKPERL